MKVLKATINQKKTIESLTNHPNVIRFILDADNNWIVNKEVLDDSKFSHIADLQNLIEIDYNPVINEISS